MQQIAPSVSLTPALPAFDVPSYLAYDAYLASHTPAAVAGFTHSASQHPVTVFLQSVWKTADVRVHPEIILVGSQAVHMPVWMRQVMARDKKLLRNTRLSFAQARAILTAALDDTYTPPTRAYPTWPLDADDEDE